MLANHVLRKSVGFIGLGQMGYPMAANLMMNLPKTTDFMVNDHAKSTAARFVKEHGGKISTIDEIASKCDTIVTMLPASAHVRQVYLGSAGLLTKLKKGTMVIDSSTIDVSTVKEVNQALLEKDVVMLDAPVSGGTGGAQAGTLTFMVGCMSEDIFTKAQFYLRFMGKNVVYCGQPGSGQIAKICNNMLLGISMIAASEAMNLGVKLGMDPKLLASIINTSSGRCWSTEVYNPCPGVMENVPSSRGYTGGFGISLMAKGYFH